MPESGSAQPIDYYRALGLDSTAPSHSLLAQISHRIAQTPPGPQRHVMEQARAILGDPGKRRIYDQRLRDPQAPDWTPQELHGLALAQSDQPAGGGFTAKLAAIPRRVLGVVAGALAILVVLIVTLASCAGSGDSTKASESGNKSQSSAPVPSDSAAEDSDTSTGELPPNALTDNRHLSKSQKDKLLSEIAATAVPAGQAMNGQAVTYRVTGVQTGIKTLGSSWYDYSYEDKTPDLVAKGQFVVIELEVTNHEKFAITTQPATDSLITSAAQMYRYDEAATAIVASPDEPSDYIHSSTDRFISSGKSVKTAIAFDIPADEDPVMIEIQPDRRGLEANLLGKLPAPSN